MNADKFNRPVSGYRGKRLDARKLPGLITGTDARVFTSPAPQRALDTYVHLVVDASYSMSEQGRMKQANLVFLGLLQVLQGMPGIKVETTAFTTVADKPVVFPHSGKSNMGFPAIGNTPLGEALDWVFYRVLGAHEKRKVLFVITDGQPNDPAKAIQSMQPFKDAGFQTIGIAISYNPSVQFNPSTVFDTAVYIKQAQQLPAALNSIWSTLLYPER
jgi:cobalamin biosynthesis protein CobT